jgi:hypothetical protein
MGHTVCFEAGRFTQTQSSATALCCSRKWMSGPADAPADAWAQFVTDRPKHIVELFVGFTTALQENLPKSAAGSLFPLDKPLSWMSSGSSVGRTSRSAFRLEPRLALRIFRPPRAARVVLASGRPGFIAADGIRGKVLELAGPWRTSGDWWTSDPWSRDEWDIALSDGAIYRLYCEPKGWFVEGSYD